MLYEKLSGQIIGASMEVLNDLRPGLNEKLYENALIIELADLGVETEQQKEYPVHYKTHFIGKLIPDLIVANKVIIETKVVESFNDTHISQLLGYLAVTNLELGLLINFKYKKLVWKRIVRQNK